MATYVLSEEAMVVTSTVIFVSHMSKIAHHSVICHISIGDDGPNHIDGKLNRQHCLLLLIVWIVIVRETANLILCTQKLISLVYHWPSPQKCLDGARLLRWRR
ncbi:uncharacterized protein PHALS_09695 [Plasmopara halstedii]|uniref:Uncharacterized protein n=1 Tax=Plasmopara halstedii TaxID=4781 RepID=A0A0P1AFG8_PLAHL|nr:uncharacterized protein PHALS_09695 [Plasmopara halstedii]CEG39449.1 hypothetical protein PHALS_09695 [Plasmopara halstedii]|eukprot:XP_024575818.1 hypothetical protein PHALS_09695 [Plasmopara halstedii]